MVPNLYVKTNIYFDFNPGVSGEHLNVGVSDLRVLLEQDDKVFSGRQPLLPAPACSPRVASRLPKIPL